MTTIEAVSDELAAAVERALPQWCRAHVCRLITASGVAGEATEDELQQMVEACVADVMPRLRALLAADIDEQRTNPLAVVRTAVTHPTEVLKRLGVPHVVRDEFAEANFPDDVYDLSPAAFSDLGPELHQLGLAWGAAKAFTHLQRRREEGLR